MSNEQFSWWPQQSRYTLLAMGLIMVYFAAADIPIMLTSKSQLAQLKGTIRSTDIQINTVNSPDQFGFNHESQKAELTFYLNEYHTKFYLAENIGSHYIDFDYLKLERGLKSGDSIAVWIKKSALNHPQPKVFEIDGNQYELLSLNEVKFKDSAVFTFLSILGIACIAFFFWFDKPTKIRKLPGIRDDD